MRRIFTSLFMAVPFLILACDYRTTSRSPSKEGNSMNIYSHTVDSLSGAPVDLGELQGQVVLIVNLASKCGYTGQYRDLQSLQNSYEGKPFTVIGFPCNDFGGQEPGGPETIEACAAGYGADFPIMAKVQVKAGDGQSPVYADLSSTMGDAPSWNFGKYLVDAQGQAVAFFGSSINPDSTEVRSQIDALLAGTNGDES
jgi:glutathione peroxidase